MTTRYPINQYMAHYARLKHGLNRSQAAQKMGVQAGTWSGWETGRSIMRVSLLPQFNTTFGTNFFPDNVGPDPITGRTTYVSTLEESNDYMRLLNLIPPKGWKAPRKSQAKLKPGVDPVPARRLKSWRKAHTLAPFDAAQVLDLTLYDYSRMEAGRLPIPDNVVGLLILHDEVSEGLTT